VDTVGAGAVRVLLLADRDGDVALGMAVGVPVSVPVRVPVLAPDAVGELGVDGTGDGGGSEVDGVGAGFRGVERAGELADAGRIRK
jgi:hypothetical protein